MSLMEYVIGGMDRGFKLKLYHALRAMDDAGLSPGITSAFRDDYRQSLASGLKAATNRSYHGGSLRGGYGHGLAADLVSVKGETRAERLISSENLWKWIDLHGKEFGIGRPYLDKDPAHVAPIDGKEYADHRRGANTQHARSEIKKRNLLAVRDDHTNCETRKNCQIVEFLIHVSLRVVALLASYMSEFAEFKISVARFGHLSCRDRAAIDFRRACRGLLQKTTDKTGRSA